MNTKWIEVGKILKTKGYDGSLRVDFYFEVLNKSIRAFFISKDRNTYTPVLVDNWTQDGQGDVVLFNKYNSKELAQQLNNTPIFISKDIVDQYFEVDSILDWIGFELAVNDNLIGKVVEVYDTPQQLTLEVKLYSNSNLVLIPLVDDWILDIDVNKSILSMILPSGLLELNN